MNSDTLQAVARTYGVDPGYWDIEGEWHPMDEGEQLILLQNITQCHSLEEMEQLSWSSPLPPVILPTEGRLHLSLTLPHAEWATPMQWQLNDEQGHSIAQGGIPQPESPPSEEKEIGAVLYQRHPITLAAPSELGYYTLHIERERSPSSPPLATSLLIVAPERSWLLENPRAWGIQVHLYTLRSSGNEGIGDLTDLATLVEQARQRGATLVGVNPLHALFPQHPEQSSPYYPSSRKALNPLYLRVAEIPEFSLHTPLAQKLRKQYLSSEGRQQLEQLRQGDWVNYSAVADFKWPRFRTLYEALLESPDAPRHHAFNTFYTEQRQQQGPLWRYALFVTLCDHFGSTDWESWPLPYQKYHSEEVTQFSHSHPQTLGFHLYLQWECQHQLSETAQEMLYLDLATGSSPQGADCWMDADSYALESRFGAPPDQFSPEGQCWDMIPFNPLTLRLNHYRPFIEMVRTNMQHARALRIDHAMALTRLYWLGQESKATTGSYVHYAQQELFAILALESHRNRCMIIGEDLGTVPEGFSEQLNQAGLLSYQLLWFQRYPSQLYLRPECWKTDALATLSSHDLPTFAGFWKNGSREERQRLLAALIDQGLWEQEPREVPDPVAIMAALQTFIARTPSRLMMANIDDLLLEPLPLNQPGTPDRPPNWRRKLSVPLDELPQHPGWIMATDKIVKERHY
ncbi:MAG: 4-alpha-glucanotransferase [Gammaproteobacteria bacterium]|jgi:4-alpha-glucanotransferase|nr:4-alpha-glucanotransferase [Gammaproteobacteria bacterium]MBT7308300.1 4-alpha-glucanotransferase [Gammaproteobacteria bacterium]